MDVESSGNDATSEEAPEETSAGGEATTGVGASSVSQPATNHIASRNGTTGANRL